MKEQLTNTNEIVKEKLYTVVIPTDDISPLQGVLCRNVENKIVVDIITQSEPWKEMDKYKLTEDEIKNYEVCNYWKYAEEVKD